MMRLTLLVVLILQATAYSLYAQHYYLRKIEINNDLTDVDFLCSTSDEKGFQYFGTDNGLFVFDGNNFRQLDSGTRSITALHCAHNKIYIGYADGNIAQMLHQKIYPIKLGNIAINSEISQIEPDATDKTLIIATKGEGLFLFKKDGCKKINTSNYLTDNYLYGFVQCANSIFVANDRGVSQLTLENTKIYNKHFSAQNGLPDNIVSSIVPIPDKKQFSLGFETGQVAFFNCESGNVEAHFDNKNILEQVNTILFDGSNKLWAGGKSGTVLLLQRQGSKLYWADSIHIQGIVHKLVKGSGGNIWALTNKGLFEIVTPHIVKLYYNPNRFLRTEISAVAPHFDSGLYYALQKQLLYFNLQKQKSTEVLNAPGIITKIFAENNILWLGTLDKGVWMYEPNSKKLKQIADGNLNTHTHVIDINHDQQNNLWIASLEGLYRCHRDAKNQSQIKQVQRYNKKDGLGSDYIHQIFTDNLNRVWLATDGAGPVYFENEKFYSFFKDSNATLLKVVYSICQNTDNSIWCSTAQNGLFQYHQNRWQQYSHKYGISNSDFLDLAAQPNGHIIALQEEAILEYLPQQNFFRKYNKLSGTNLDSLGTNINLMAQDSAGTILLPVQDGFIMFNRNEAIDQISKIRISKIQVFLKDVQWGKNNFKHDENQISFEYEFTNFTHSDKLYFRYRLMGQNEQWINTNDQKITFSKLSPGQYSFEVQVSHNPGFDGAQTDLYPFKIEKAFWQEWWFYSLIALGLAYFLRMYLKMREKNIRRKESLQKEKLHFEFEHLKSQINPHFLFNSLNTLVDLIDEDSLRATDYTIHLAAMYRSLLAFSDKELISIKEEITLLNHYIFVQKCRFGDALNIQINIDENTASEGKIVPLALQLLVENAIKHNEVSRGNPLIIQIFDQQKSLIIQNPLRPKISQQKGEGLGIANLQKRYQLLVNKNIVIEKTIEYFIVKLPIV